ncbi:MAG TPA: biotin/lipoyl-binding protein, partial [Anaerolineales bacterium]
MLADPRGRWLVIVAGILILAAAGAFAYTRIAASTTPKAASTVQSLTSVARRGTITLSAIGTGTLQPANEVQLGFGGNTSGKLVTLNVKVGDKVKAGELLAEIDNSQTKIS